MVHTSTTRAGARSLSLGTALLLLFGRAALAGEPAVAGVGPAPLDDPVLAGLVKEALEKRPELAQARATIRADLARAPQVRALPDPVLTLGIQNDGFRRLQIGEMETSYLTVMASQTFPWYGKRELRGDVITLGVHQAESDLQRAWLSIRAEVERAYLDLLLGRAQLQLLTKLDALWTQAQGLARARYESADGAQSDILRAQLERSRLRQRRWALEAENRRRLAVLNRMRGQPFRAPIATSQSLVDLPDPTPPSKTAAFEEAEAQSPELKRSRLAVKQSATLVKLAQKDYFPDLTVTAGVMPRWGKFEPMWQAGLAFSLPIWGGSKQARAVAENRLREAAAAHGAEATRQLLRQRVMERLTLTEALIDTNRLYRSGLLVQSEATVSSTMAQYRVGRVTFASVLEALVGYVTDLNAFYESIAAIQRVEIARREVSLDAPVGPVASGMSGSSVPGAGVMGGNASAGPGAPSLQPAGATGATSMPRM
ncbi:MAG: TolC family protein [Deltaproteobacteria bacterium]|nr:TolC family protein [Deltaproteobacteria bacterium]